MYTPAFQLFTQLEIKACIAWHPLNFKQSLVNYLQNVYLYLSFSLAPKPQTKFKGKKENHKRKGKRAKIALE